METTNAAPCWVDQFTGFLNELQMPKNDEFYLDVDFALEQANREREYNGKPKINRKQLSELTGIHYQGLVNYKAGRIPATFLQLRRLEEITGRSLDQLIKPKL
jgi:hypothetical protein